MNTQITSATMRQLATNYPIYSNSPALETRFQCTYIHGKVERYDLRVKCAGYDFCSTRFTIVRDLNVPTLWKVFGSARENESQALFTGSLAKAKVFAISALLN